MAKGCVYYDIQECAGGPWTSVLEKPFRDTVHGALRRFKMHLDGVEPEVSARLVEGRVIEQKNGEGNRKVKVSIKTS